MFLPIASSQLPLNHNPKSSRRLLMVCSREQNVQTFSNSVIFIDYGSKTSEVRQLLAKSEPARHTRHLVIKDWLLSRSGWSKKVSNIGFLPSYKLVSLSTEFTEPEIYTVPSSILDDAFFCASKYGRGSDFRYTFVILIKATWKTETDSERAVYRNFQQ